MRSVLILLVTTTGVARWATAAPTQVADSAEREAVYERYLDIRSRVVGGSVEPHWLSDGNRFWYVEGAPANVVVYVVDPEARTRAPLFDTARLRQSLAAFLRHEPPYRGVPFSTFALVNGEREARFALEGRELIVDLETYSVREAPTLTSRERDRITPRVVRVAYPENSGDVREILSPDGRWFLGENHYNLWLRSTYDGREVPLTTDGVEQAEWYVTGSRQTTALGPARWSPDSWKVAAIKSDSRAMTRVPIVHWLKPTEEVQWYGYTKAGGPMPMTELYVLDILTRRQIKIDAGTKPDHFFHILGWLPDGSEVWFLRMNRTFKRLDVMAADPHTGKSRIIITETQPTFIKGIAANPGWTGLFTPLPTRRRFLWISERDGWDHLYLYDRQGRLVRRLTEGAWPVLRVLAVDEAEGWVYFVAHGDAERPYDTHLYRVNLDGTGFSQLTQGSGTHVPALSPSRRYFLDTHSDLDRPPVVELRAADGSLLDTLSRANIDALAELRWRPPERFIAKAADDSTNLYGVLFRPYDFDANRRYPVIEYIYGGPQTSLVPKSFLAPGGLFTQALAQLGFITVIVDARGTPERGKAFQDVVYGNFGRNEVPDHAGLMRQLGRQRPYMDLSRVGIFGGSWGGYMTIRAMLLAPEVYRVGVSIYPVVDHADHWNLIDQYMGLPGNDPEGYAYGSSLRLADRLEGKLLITHGTADMNATFSATMKMVEALTRAGKPYDLAVFPDENHSFGPTATAYRTMILKNYFIEHLKPGRME